MIRIASLYFVLFVQFIDVSIVAIGLTPIALDLHVEAVLTQWVVTAYGVGGAVALPLCARLLRSTSPRSILAYGMLVSLLASYACSVSDGLGSLVCARFFQGFASGCIMLVGQRLLIEFLGEQRKAFAFTLWTSAASIAPVIGPLAGATALELANWRWMFIINIPLIGLCLVLLRHELIWKVERIEWRNGFTQVILLGVITVLTQFLTSKLMSPDTEQLIPISNEALTITLVFCIAIFMAIGEHTGDYVFRWSLFKNTTFFVSSISLSLISSFLVLSFIMIPTWLQGVRHFSYLRIAYIIGATGIVAGILSPIVGRKVAKRFMPGVACLSLLLMAGSFFISSAWQATSPMSSIILPRLVLGVSIALAAVLAPLGMQRFSGPELNDANSVALFTRMIVGNVAVGMLAGSIDQLTRFLGGYSVSGMWLSTSANEVHAASRQAASLLDATVATYVIKIASGAAGIAVLTLMALLILTFLPKMIRGQPLTIG